MKMLDENCNQLILRFNRGEIPYDDYITMRKDIRQRMIELRNIKEFKVGNQN